MRHIELAGPGPYDGATITVPDRTIAVPDRTIAVVLIGTDHTGQTQASVSVDRDDTTLTATDIADVLRDLAHRLHTTTEGA